MTTLFNILTILVVGIVTIVVNIFIARYNIGSDLVPIEVKSRKMYTTLPGLEFFRKRV